MSFDPDIKRLWRILLIALILWAAGVRLHGILVLKQGLSHDESVSYLCASATEGAYQIEIDGMLDRDLHVLDIQAFYARPPGMAFPTVARDLALWDIHPPLYFWTLHAVHVAFGAGVIGGALLNFVAGLLLLALVFIMARRALASTSQALAAVAIWYLSPAVVQIDLEARHYQFMALFAIASFLMAERLSNEQRSKTCWMLFTLVNAAGLLTHYYFAFLLLPGALVMLIRYGWTRPTFTYAGSLLASLALFLLAFPQIFDFIGTYSERLSNPEATTGALDRIKTVTYASLAFFTEWHRARYMYIFLLIAAGLFAMYRIPRPIAQLKFPLDRPVTHYGIALLWSTCFTVGFYLVGISPAQAAGEQYFAYFWPLLAVLLVHVASRTIPARYVGWIFAAHMAQLPFAYHSSVHGSEYVKNVLPAEWYEEIGSADLLITDDHKRANLPRIASSLRAEQALFLYSKVVPAFKGEERVAFLHLAIDSRPAPNEIFERMSEMGFRSDGPTKRHDHFELHFFRR